MHRIVGIKRASCRFEGRRDWFSKRGRKWNRKRNGYLFANIRESLKKTEDLAKEYHISVDNVNHIIQHVNNINL